MLHPVCTQFFGSSHSAVLVLSSCGTSMLSQLPLYKEESCRCCPRNSFQPALRCEGAFSVGQSPLALNRFGLLCQPRDSGVVPCALVLFLPLCGWSVEVFGFGHTVVIRVRLGSAVPALGFFPSGETWAPRLMRGRICGFHFIPCWFGHCGAVCSPSHQPFLSALGVLGKGFSV